MTNKEAVNWLINIMADIGKVEHSNLWHYEQALIEIREMLESQPELHYDEWCYSCKEYDAEKHCCPRWNKVIREALRNAQRWIPCSERLPDKNCRCLTTNDAWGAFEVDLNAWIDGQWLYPNDEPVAWMPLPKAYSEDVE